MPIKIEIIFGYCYNVSHEQNTYFMFEIPIYPKNIFRNNKRISEKKYDCNLF